MTSEDKLQHFPDILPIGEKVENAEIVDPLWENKVSDKKCNRIITLMKMKMNKSSLFLNHLNSQSFIIAIKKIDLLFKKFNMAKEYLHHAL